MKHIPRIAPSEAAEAAGCSRQRILLLAKQGRIPGALQAADGRWSIPRDFQVNPAPKRPGRRLDKL